MSDYISKSELIEKFKDLADEHETNAISYVALCEVILQQKSIDEKEIIRKTFERVLERLEKTEMKIEEKFHYLMDTKEKHSHPCKYDKSDLFFERLQAFGEAIEIVKEECGISE